MIRMTLCPNCKTIQKHATACTICKCPVHSPHTDVELPASGKTKDKQSTTPDFPGTGFDHKYQI